MRNLEDAQEQAAFLSDPDMNREPVGTVKAGTKVRIVEVAKDAYTYTFQPTVLRHTYKADHITKQDRTFYLADEVKPEGNPKHLTSFRWEQAGKVYVVTVQTKDIVRSR